MNKTQLEILQAIVDEQEANPSIAVTEHQIAERVGLELQEIRANLNLLARKGCVQLKDVSCSFEAVWAKITPEGYMALKGRDEFLGNVENSSVSIGSLIQVGTAYNSQFQQGTHNSTQDLHNDSTVRVVLSELLKDIKELANHLRLDAESENELQSDIQTLEIQASSSKPKKPILKATLESVAAIIKGSVEKAISSELVLHTPTVLHRITEFLQNLGQ